MEGSGDVFKSSFVLVTYSDTDKDSSSGQTLFSYTDHLRFEKPQWPGVDGRKLSEIDVPVLYRT